MDPLGANRDRHASMTKGTMGKGLHTFLAHPAFQGCPAILETPGPDGNGPNALEVKRLKRLARAAPGRDLRTLNVPLYEGGVTGNRRFPASGSTRSVAENRGERECAMRFSHCMFPLEKTRKLGRSTGIS